MDASLSRRARYGWSRARVGGPTDTLERDDACAPALLAAGYRSGELTPAELLRFRSQSAEYLECRKHILTMWSQDMTKFLTLQHCLQAPPPTADPALMERAYAFLAQQGAINLGLLLGDPRVPFYASLSPATELEVGRELYRQLRQVDLDVVSEKKLRLRVAATLHIEDMEPFKSFIREQVECYLSKGYAVPSKFAEPAPLCAPAPRVLVLGAGPAGLWAALHLRRQGAHVAVLEAREEPGGRVRTLRSGAFEDAPADAGAGAVWGAEVDLRRGAVADPAAQLCRQLGLEVCSVGSEIPRLDAEQGGPVEPELDARVELLHGRLMEDVARVAEARKMRGGEAEEGEALALSEDATLGQALSAALAARLDRDGSDILNALVPDGESACPIPWSSTADRLLHWHWASLERGCAAPIDSLSLEHWDQDEAFGGFGGPPAVVPGGLDVPFAALARALHVVYRARAVGVQVREGGTAEEGAEGAVLDAALGTTPGHHALATFGDRSAPVCVSLEDGRSLHADAVVCALPLGVLQHPGAVRFDPPLPSEKQGALRRLAPGRLNKVLLRFEGEPFWDPEADSFGAVGEASAATRGKCSVFWNLGKRVGGQALLAALVSGEAARQLEEEDDVEDEDDRAPGGEPLPAAVRAALERLEALFPEAPRPLAARVKGYHVTAWGRDPAALGAASSVAAGSSGHDYEALARPEGEALFFAGEHTSRRHPGTVGGAMLSGLRAAVRLLERWEGREESGEEEAHGRSTKTLTSAQNDDSAVLSSQIKDSETSSSHSKDARAAATASGEAAAVPTAQQRRKPTKDSKKRPPSPSPSSRRTSKRVKGPELRTEQVLGPDAARQEEMQRLVAHGVADSRVVLRGLQGLGSGDAAPLERYLDEAQGLKRRAEVVGRLLAATDDRQKGFLAQEASVLARLAAWLREALDQPGDDASKLAEACMKLLGSLYKGVVEGKLQLALVGAVSDSWLLLQRASRHADPEVRRLAGRMLIRCAPPGNGAGAFETGGGARTASGTRRDARWGNEVSSGVASSAPLPDAEALATVEALQKDAAEARRLAEEMAAKVQALEMAQSQLSQRSRETQQTFEQHMRNQARSEGAGAAHPARGRVDAIIKELLLDAYRGSRVTKDGYKRIRQRAVDHLLRHHVPRDAGADYFGSKRKAKYKDFLNKYIKAEVDARKQARKKAVGREGAAAGAAPGEGEVGAS